MIKKAGDGSKKIKGCWDSIHVVEVNEKSSGRSAHYKLTSTAMLWLQTNKQGSGTMNLGGSLTRQVGGGLKQRGWRELTLMAMLGDKAPRSTFIYAPHFLLENSLNNCNNNSTFI